MKIIDFIKNLLDSLMSGSFERLKIVNGMNEAFKEYYYSGELNRLCKVSIAPGNPNFRHEMSAAFFRSGFKISIENDNGIRESEMREISKYILSNTAFIRQLMSIGFDTLYMVGKTTQKNIAYALKEYGSLENFFLE